MAQASPHAPPIAVVRTYWKGLALGVAVTTWLAVLVTPKVGFTTKLSFGAFMLRTYWPEIIVVLILIGATLGLLHRFRALAASPATAGNAVARRILGTVRQVSAWHRFSGLIVIGITVAACVPLLWKQVGLMVEAEQIFYATRLMNWFGNDLHRIAARQINNGNYAAAVRTLKVQSRELGESEEGKTAARVAASLAYRIAFVDSQRQRTLDVMKRAGVVRSDLLMLGVLHAMLPPHPLGVEHSATVPGAESVQTYLDALRRVKAHCDGPTGVGTSLEDLGMATAALGFARSPRLLFGNAEDPGTKAEILCDIVRPLNAAGVDELHRAAFSVSALSKRTDWRMPVQDDGGTPGVMVIRSFGRAFDAAIKRATGLTPLKRWLPAMESQDAPDRHSTEILESDVMSIIKPSPVEKTNVKVFAPVTLIANAANKTLAAYALVGRLRSGIELTLCIPTTDSAVPVEGYLFKMRPDGRLQIAGSDVCTGDAGAGDSIRRLDASLLAAISRFITLVDAGRVLAMPATLRGALCRVLVAGAPKRAPDSVGTAINLCPLDAAAAGLSSPSDSGS